MESKLMQKMRVLHCGDVFRNHYAGDNNPSKVFMFLKNKGKYSACIALDGSELYDAAYYTSDLKRDDHFQVIGHFPIKDILMQELKKHLEEIADEHK